MMGNEERKFAGESNWKKINAGDKNTGDISSDGDGILWLDLHFYVWMRVCMRACMCVCTVCVCAGPDT